MCLIGVRAKSLRKGGKRQVMFKMNHYDEAKADSLDKLIRAALLAAAERLRGSQKQSFTLLSRIKRECYNRKKLPYKGE